MLCVWLVWGLMLSWGSCGNDPHGVGQCGPQNVAVDAALLGEQRILLRWEDGSSCDGIDEELTYEVEVLRDDKLVHQDVAVLSDKTQQAHSWSWTSPLPLDCASHSVRLRTASQTHRSAWSQLLITPEEKPSRERPVLVFPRDRVAEVGSTVTFCCVLGENRTFGEMQLNNVPLPTRRVSAGVRAATVRLQHPSHAGSTNLHCNNRRYGTLVYIGYRPGDQNLTCETRDLVSVECRWAEGRRTRLLGPERATTYTLDGSPCSADDEEEDVCSEEGSCSCRQDVQVGVGEKAWTLSARNPLGTVELADRADLRARVRMLAPDTVRAHPVNARSASLWWRWTVPTYRTLHLQCQVRLLRPDGGRASLWNVSGLGLESTVLTGLIPRKKYTAQIRCGTTHDFWKHGDWSEQYMFVTKGDVPDALDVWMHSEQNQTVILWKTPLADQSHGDIIDYTVTWGRTTRHNTSSTGQNSSSTGQNSSSTGQNRMRLRLDSGRDYEVTVTARNAHGSSPPSSLSVPAVRPEIKGLQPLPRVSGGSGGVFLSWTPSPAASGGYVVDWCAAFRPCSLGWKKLPAGETTARIEPEHFEDGVRYILSVYARTGGAAQLLGRTEGYGRETQIMNEIEDLKQRQTGSDVTISWTAIPPQNQSAFVRGYVLYYTGASVSNVRTDDPEACSLTARRLPAGSYLFTVKARTAQGEGGATSTRLTLAEEPNLLLMVLLPACLVLLISVLCCRSWTCIKQMISSPVPTPFLPDNWLKQPGDQRCQILQVAAGDLSEVNVVAPEIDSIDEEEEEEEEEEPLKRSPSPPPPWHVTQYLKRGVWEPNLCPAASLPIVLTSIMDNLMYNMDTTTGDAMMEDGYQTHAVFAPH